MRVQICDVLPELRRIGAPAAKVLAMSDGYSLGPNGIYLQRFHTNSSIEDGPHKAPISESWSTDLSIDLLMPIDFDYACLARGKLTNTAPPLAKALVDTDRMAAFMGSGATIAKLGNMMGFSKSRSTDMEPEFADKLTKAVKSSVAYNNHVLRLIKAICHILACAEAAVMRQKTPKGPANLKSFSVCSVDMKAVKAVLTNKYKPIYCGDKTDMAYSAFLAMIVKGYPLMKWDRVPVHGSFTMPAETLEPVVVNGSSGWATMSPGNREVAMRRLCDPKVLTRYVRQYVDDMGIFEQYNYAMSVAIGMGNSVRHGAMSVTIPCGEPNCLIDLFPALRMDSVFMPKLESFTSTCVPELCGASIADALLTGALRMSLDVVPNNQLTDRRRLARLARSYGGHSIENRINAIECMASELGSVAIATMARNDPLRSLGPDQLEHRGRRELECRNHIDQLKHYYEGSTLGCVAEPVFPTRDRQDRESTRDVRSREAAQSYMAAELGSSVLSMRHAEDVDYQGTHYRSPVAGLAAVYTIGDMIPHYYEEMKPWVGGQMRAIPSAVGPSSGFKLTPNRGATLYRPYMSSKVRPQIPQSKAYRGKERSCGYDPTDVSPWTGKGERRRARLAAKAAAASAAPVVTVEVLAGALTGLWTRGWSLANQSAVTREPIVHPPMALGTRLSPVKEGEAVEEKYGHVDIAPMGSPRKPLTKKIKSARMVKNYMNRGVTKSGKTKKANRAMLGMIEKIKKDRVKVTPPAVYGPVDLSPTHSAFRDGPTVAISKKMLASAKEEPKPVVPAPPKPTEPVLSKDAKSELARGEIRDLYRGMTRVDRKFADKVARRSHQLSGTQDRFKPKVGDARIDAVLSVMHRSGHGFNTVRGLVDSSNVAHGKFLEHDINCMVARIDIYMTKWRKMYSDVTSLHGVKLENMVTKILEVADEYKSVALMKNRHREVYWPAGGAPAPWTDAVSEDEYNAACASQTQRDDVTSGFQPLSTMVARLEQLMVLYTDKATWKYKGNSSLIDRPVVNGRDIYTLMETPGAFVAEVRINAWAGYLSVKSGEKVDGKLRVKPKEQLVTEARNAFVKCGSVGSTAMGMWCHLLEKQMPGVVPRVTMVTGLELMAAAALVLSEAETVSVGMLARAITFDNMGLGCKTRFSRDSIAAFTTGGGNGMINDLMRGGAGFIECIIAGHIDLPTQVKNALTPDIIG